MQPGRSRPNQPMTYIEQKRAESQRMYQEEQKYWRDHSEEFKKYVIGSLPHFLPLCRPLDAD